MWLVEKNEKKYVDRGELGFNNYKQYCYLIDRVIEWLILYKVLCFVKENLYSLKFWLDQWQNIWKLTDIYLGKNTREKNAWFRWAISKYNFKRKVCNHRMQRGHGLLGFNPYHGLPFLDQKIMFYEVQCPLPLLLYEFNISHFECS